MPKVHYVKSHPQFFRPFWRGEKTAELRRDDRGYEVGDTLVQMEWEPTTQIYTENEIHATISHIVRSTEHLTDGFVMLSLRDVRCFTQDYFSAFPDEDARQHVYAPGGFDLDQGCPVQP